MQKKSKYLVASATFLVICVIWEILKPAESPIFEHLTSMIREYFMPILLIFVGLGLVAMMTTKNSGGSKSLKLGLFTNKWFWTCVATTTAIVSIYFLWKHDLITETNMVWFSVSAITIGLLVASTVSSIRKGKWGEVKSLVLILILIAVPTYLIWHGIERFSGPEKVGESQWKYHVSLNKRELGPVINVNGRSVPSGQIAATGPFVAIVDGGKQVLYISPRILNPDGSIKEKPFSFEIPNDARVFVDGDGSEPFLLLKDGDKVPLPEVNRNKSLKSGMTTIQFGAVGLPVTIFHNID